MIRSMDTLQHNFSILQKKQEMVSSNIANVDTIGYKARQAEFETLLENNYPASESLLLGDDVEVLTINSGSRAADYTIDFSLGNIVASEGPHQYAVAVEGFFQVTAENGAVFYSRDGSFTVDTTGSYLVNARGERMTMAGNSPAVFQPVTTTESLMPAGENKYTATEAMQQADVEVLVGYIEQSNVDLATAITDMMIAQRAYAMNSKAAQSTDEMLSGINQFKQ